MIETLKTGAFTQWLDGLPDIRARARILVRIERLAAGNPGDEKPVGEGVSEMRIDYGPGYSGVLQEDRTEGGHIIGWRR